MQKLEELRAVVQRNCHVSDALYARNYSLCTYLLKMREYYRWEKGYALGAALPGEEVGNWVEQREQFWETLKTEGYTCLPVRAECYNPFNSAVINRLLVPEGLVYSGGYGRFGKPHFFLGDLLRLERQGELTIYVSAGEYARDLTAPPAMMQDKSIFIRRESLRRSIWEMVEEWQWRRRPGPMAQVVEHYGFESDPDGAIDRMTDNEIVTVVLHEEGEAMAGEILGESWHDMLFAIADSKAELIARAVRDHLADCLSTLPGLLEMECPACIHFYFANLRAIRRELFPRALVAYERWFSDGSLESLRALLPEAREHWASVATAMLALHTSGGEELQQSIEDLYTTSARL